MHKATCSDLSLIKQGSNATAFTDAGQTKPNPELTLLCALFCQLYNIIHSYGKSVSVFLHLDSNQEWA